MRYTDLHTHTTFCDGKSTPRDMALSAIEKGIGTLGMVVHSYLDFDNSYTVKKGCEADFVAEVRALSGELGDKIKLLAGLECDLFSEMPSVDFDYVIGSVHYVERNGKYHPIDLSKESLKRTADECFGGDFLALAEEYYRCVARLSELSRIDIVGHFDLITKFDEDESLIDRKNPRYIAAWRSAADALLPLGIPFEINTGAISRGYRTTPYPAQDIIDYLSASGASFILSSDAHSKDGIAYHFSATELP